jgi:hypothetical protein
MTQKFFIDRRSGEERRSGADKRKNPRLDLPHKRRRKSGDRRRADGSVIDDFYAVHGMEPEDFRSDGHRH